MAKTDKQTPLNRGVFLTNREQMFDVLCVGVLLIGLVALLAGYAKSTADTLKDLGLINPLTVTLAILAIIGIIAELLR